MAAPRASDGGRVGKGSSAPPVAAAMRATSTFARAATESGGAARTTIARRRASSVSATARTRAGRAGASRRACSRNCRASSTSAAAVTRPPPGTTPAAYSLAASAVAATMRRATASESPACPAAWAAAHALNSKLTNSLRKMRVILNEGASNTRVILSGIQGCAPRRAPAPRSRRPLSVCGRATAAHASRPTLGPVGSRCR